MKLHEFMPELVGATAWINGVTSKEQLVGNKPVLFHFWSVSCYMCKDAMPVINQFRDKYKDNLNIVAVHIPRSEADVDINLVKSSAEAHDIKHPIFIDNALKLRGAFGNEQVPAYYVFDKDGRLRHFQSGGSGMKLLEKRITRLLNEKK
ncbi:TlpA disulfide reductase family protein [Sporosarcina sp. 6E9]|uniref:TlpA family protein disulfide reductase n=1 Tax=Sporosarcina sp. 6E9 TaxID=2819235 RepID=UPI001B318031|nr:TlpA disulfide reductase family protein [Sporosarcina sp. 6E9]